MHRSIAVGSLIAAAAASLPVYAQEGRFQERLQRAQQGASVKRPQRGSAAASPRVRVRTYRSTTPARPRRPRSRQVRPTRSVRPRPVVRTAEGRNWRFRPAQVADVTYGIAPRAAGSMGNPRTGDLRLLGEPQSTRVYFYVRGGSRLRDVNEAVVKNQPIPGDGKRLYILAVAPGIRGRASAFVPVKAGHITTVRFKFRGPSASAPPAHEPDDRVRIQIVEPD